MGETKNKHMKKIIVRIMLVFAFVFTFTGQAFYLPDFAAYAAEKDNVVAYRVQPDDTLYAIARRNGLTVLEIKLCNGLTGDKIQAGQTLYLPNSNSETASYAENGATSSNYKVQPDDTLWKIAVKYGLSVAEIKRYNGLTSDDINAGQTLYLPTTKFAGDSPKREVRWYSVTLSNPGTDEDSWYNIELAAKMLNNYRLGPGETFDWEDYMGPCDLSQNFKKGKGYSRDENGEIITIKVPGGGVCFNSTTLFQAARGAYCDRIVNYDHSKGVGYADPGDEAAVSYGSKNLTFRNPSKTQTLVFYCSTNKKNYSCTVTAVPVEE